MSAHLDIQPVHLLDLLLLYGTRLLGLGRAVEVLEPETLRKSLVDFAEQVVGFYKK